MKIDITEEDGELIVEESWRKEREKFVLSNGMTFWVVDEVKNYVAHRWAETSLYVLANDSDELWGLKYDWGSTEMQESGFVYSRPELVKLQAKEVVITTYEEEQ